MTQVFVLTSCPQTDVAINEIWLLFHCTQKSAL